MTSGSMFVDIEDVPSATLDRSQGWAISDFRIPISGQQGCSSLMYEAVFAPGDAHHKHRLACEEMYYIKSGRGLAGVGDERAEVGEGDYHLVPAGVEHWLVNIDEAAPLVVIGFYDRAASLDAIGHEYLGDVEAVDLAPPRETDRSALRYPLVNQRDVSNEDVDPKDGWTISHFCQPLNGDEHGSATCWMYGYQQPGHVHQKHRHDHCEEICYILTGDGVAAVADERRRVRAGTYHYIPAGVEHWLCNTSDTAPLIGPGVYIGVAGLEASGYVHHGPVTPDDLAIAD